MNIRKEILKHSAELDKEVLLWLFEKYHFQSEWRFVSRCVYKRYGTQSYQIYRVWTPTKEGRILWKARKDLK